MAAAAAAGAAAGSSAASYIVPAAMSAGSGILGSILGKIGQSENLSYAQQFNQQVMEREDNYLQRRVQDAIAAGFSPLAALEGASNYSSNATVPFVDSIAYTNPLVNGFNQAAQNLIGSGGIFNERLKINEEKRFHNMTDKLERDKLTTQENHWIDELSTMVDIANSKNINDYNIAQARNTLEERLKNLDLVARDVMQDKELDQQWKIFKTQFDESINQFEKSKNQAERKIWVDALTKLAGDALDTFVGRKMITIRQ